MLSAKVRPPTPRTGDYSREQNERIHQLESALKTAVRLIRRGDPASLAFAAANAEDVLEQGNTYHVSYPQWLENVRKRQ